MSPVFENFSERFKLIERESVRYSNTCTDLREWIYYIALEARTRWRALKHSNWSHDIFNGTCDLLARAGHRIMLNFQQRQVCSSPSIIITCPSCVSDIESRKSSTDSAVALTSIAGSGASLSPTYTRLSASDPRLCLPSLAQHIHRVSKVPAR